METTILKVTDPGSSAQLDGQSPAAANHSLHALVINETTRISDRLVACFEGPPLEVDVHLRRKRSKKKRPKSRQ